MLMPLLFQLPVTCRATHVGMAQDMKSYAQMQEDANLVQHNPKIAHTWDDHEDFHLLFNDQTSDKRRFDSQIG